MKRPTVQDWAMELVVSTAKRGTCIRRQVGAVLLNERNHILATGYNGAAAGQPHCNEPSKLKLLDGGVVATYRNACEGAVAESGMNLDKCLAIHAEQNALLQCPDVFKIHTLYTSTSPCMTCTKLLLNTSCQIVIYGEDYPHNDAKKLWRDSGRIWVCYDQLKGKTQQEVKAYLLVKG